jgi:hypothetical protein
MEFGELSTSIRAAFGYAVRTNFFQSFLIMIYVAMTVDISWLPFHRYFSVPV